MLHTHVLTFIPALAARPSLLSEKLNGAVRNKSVFVHTSKKPGADPGFVKGGFFSNIMHAKRMENFRTEPTSLVDHAHSSLKWLVEYA